jgi:hypothetical protein
LQSLIIVLKLELARLYEQPPVVLSKLPLRKVWAETYTVDERRNANEVKR